MPQAVVFNQKEYEEEILRLYEEIKNTIISRINDFKKVWAKASNEELFIELAFCLFTPQSSARQCWKAVNILIEKNLLFQGRWEDISAEINIVRFRNNKSKYLVEARDRFISGSDDIRARLCESADQYERRAWLVKNIKGMGFKEAGHYMRNIGIGEDLAILDRHILKNMKLLGVIDEVPGSLPPLVYRELENRLQSYSKSIGIPMDHLDFVLWYKEAGEVFK